MASLTSVSAKMVSKSETNKNLSIVKTELPPDLAKDAKFKTGFIAVPNYAWKHKEGAAFGSVELDNETKSIQYTDKTGNRQTAKVAVEDLVAAHKEAVAEYRKQRASEVAKDAPEVAAPEMGE